VPRFGVLVLTAVLGAIVLPSTALGAVHSGSGTDPGGDGPTGARDLTALSATYDDVAGSVSVTIGLGAVADASTSTTAIATVGTLDPAGMCGATDAPFVLLGARTDSPDGADALWTLNGGTSSSATLAHAGTSLTISVTSAQLVGGTPNCATASLYDNTTSATHYDDFDAPIALTAPAPPPTQPPAPPAPAPTPAPTPVPTPTPPAVPATKAPAHVPVVKGPKLTLAVSGVPRTIRRNRAMKVKVKVLNGGTAAARSVKLKVGTARGLSVTPRTVSIKTIKQGKSSTHTIRITLTRKARTVTTVSLTASGAQKLVARSRLALRIGTARPAPKPKAPPPGQTGPAKPANPLVGTYWWYNVNHPDYAWDNRGVYFIDANWAYRGLPKGGLPTSCTAVTATGEDTDGCIQYTYDAATGVVTLGDKAGTFTGGALTIDDQTYDALVIAAPGARYSANLTHRSFHGLCGPYSFCTTSLETLALLPDGEFVRSSSSLSTLDTAVGFSAAGAYPPDQHGTYEVQVGGKIHFAYADGTTKDQTFAVQTTAGAPDPTTAGVMVDDENFYYEAPD
jgi:hypothetical protein